MLVRIGYVPRRGCTLKAVVCTDFWLQHISAVCCGRPEPMQCCLVEELCSLLLLQRCGPYVGRRFPQMCKYNSAASFCLIMHRELTHSCPLLCHWPHHESIINDCGACSSCHDCYWGPSAWIIQPDWSVDWLTLYHTDHSIISYIPPLIQITVCASGFTAAVPLLQPSTGFVVIVRLWDSVCSGNLIAAIEHLMNWICSDSDDPGQSYPGHRLAQAGWRGGTEIEQEHQGNICCPTVAKKNTHLLSCLKWWFSMLEIFILPPSLRHK